MTGVVQSGDTRAYATALLAEVGVVPDQGVSSAHSVPAGSENPINAIDIPDEILHDPRLTPFRQYLAGGVVIGEVEDRSGMLYNLGLTLVEVSQDRSYPITAEQVAGVVKNFDIKVMGQSAKGSKYADRQDADRYYFDLAAKVMKTSDSGQQEDGWAVTESGPYVATPEGLFWKKKTKDGETAITLQNFPARIVADVCEDDGAEEHHSLEIVALVNKRTKHVTIPASQFAGMNWAIQHLGPNAILLPGFGTKDHARAAIQFLSGDVPTRKIYTHTGWREIDGQQVYLHAGGALGPQGPLPGIETRLDGALSLFRLPHPPSGDALRTAVRASLYLAPVAPPPITVPILGATYRAVLGAADSSLHLSGPTGVFKTELAALAQQHFGATMNSRLLPASWSSTANSLEGLAFLAKDALLVVDDFAPTGSAIDIQRFHRDADRVLRAQGNMSGRQRMRSDATLRPPKPPRGLIVSTGEDVPRGQSLRARFLTLEVGPDDVDLKKLTVAQKDASTGIYAQAMAGFIQWLAPQYKVVRAKLPAEIAELRDLAQGSGQHRRTPEIVANLALGLRYLLRFAQEVGAITAEEGGKLSTDGWKALGQAAAAQAHHQAASEPTERFLQLLGAAIASGTAHFASPSGDAPETPEAWGWRRHMLGSQPQGRRAGWVDGTDLYLEFDAAYSVAQAMGQSVGDGLTIQPQTLLKRMHDRNPLLPSNIGAIRTGCVCGETSRASRLLEVVGVDLLGLENSIARGRTLISLVLAGAKLLEIGEHEERLAAVEATLGKRRADRRR
jgi:hypothetical protein